MFVCSCSGVNLTMMWFHGALKKRPSNTITVVTMMTCQCVTALTLTCWCISESPSSVSAKHNYACCEVNLWCYHFSTKLCGPVEADSNAALMKTTLSLVVDLRACACPLSICTYNAVVMSRWGPATGHRQWYPPAAGGEAAGGEEGGSPEKKREAGGSPLHASTGMEQTNYSWECKCSF